MFCFFIKTRFNIIFSEVIFIIYKEGKPGEEVISDPCGEGPWLEGSKGKDFAAVGQDPCPVVLGDIVGVFGFDPEALIPEAELPRGLLTVSRGREEA